jgi:PTH1 family peptidyl-tRNA hydrolase
MGLFVRRENTDSASVPAYSIGLNQSLLIVGLGNPGKEYSLTRHNIGFYCLDDFARSQEARPWSIKKDLKCELATLTMGSKRIILCKPTTFMNNSGEAVQAVQHFYKISPAETLVVHDELDLEFGQIRTRNGGSAAGNNGLKSIIEHGGENTCRLRVGVHNTIADKADAAEFVLGKFTKDEQAKLPALSREVSVILNEYLASGDLPHDTRSF